jgi:hypothetical protein
VFALIHQEEIQRTLRVFVFDVFQLIVTSPRYDDAKHFIIILAYGRKKGPYWSNRLLCLTCLSHRPDPQLRWSPLPLLITIPSHLLVLCVLLIHLFFPCYCYYKSCWFVGYELPWRLGARELIIQAHYLGRKGVVNRKL